MYLYPFYNILMNNCLIISSTDFILNRTMHISCLLLPGHTKRFYATWRNATWRLYAVAYNGVVTHRPRTGDAWPAHWNFAVLASALLFAKHASLCVTRSSSAFDQRYALDAIRFVRRDFLCMHKIVRRARRMNLRATRTPDTRRVR